jgi:hypothetical protein
MAEMVRPRPRTVRSKIRCIETVHFLSVESHPCALEGHRQDYRPRLAWKLLDPVASGPGPVRLYSWYLPGRIECHRQQMY